MANKLGLISACIGISIISYSFVKVQQDNQPPVVKITGPQNNSTFDWDAPVSYKITVSDKEDGESKFDEINAKEVLLEIRRVTGKSKQTAASTKSVQNDASGLTVIMTSNCINCHNFNSKSIGPSFYEISKRYPATKSNTDSLIKRIREGSSGIWGGKEKMPTHSELTIAEIKSSVQWIFKNATDPNVNYYIGTEGFFRIKSPATTGKGTYILTASYTDHGLKSVPGKHLQGHDVVTIHSK
jgi:cytochrome c